MKKNLIHLGTFGNPFGLKGDIKIKFHTLTFDSFKSFNNKFIDELEQKFNFKYIRKYKNVLIGKLENCSNKNCAKKLSGKKIFIYRSFLPKTKNNEYYVNDLIDCKVKNLKNKLLGKIIDVKNYGAGDLIYIKKNTGKNFFIPMNDENISKIDLENKNVIVNPMKGLLD